MWVDVSSTDIDKSCAFYSSLFGWEGHVVMPYPDGGGYSMFYVDGKSVAGASPTISPEQPSAWSVYICTKDADATAEAVKDAGGQVIAEPMDVADQGRFAVFADPSGAYFSVWQPQAHHGAELVNEPGSFGWNELYTRDIPGARKFYEKVVGWGAEDTEFTGGKYTLFQVDGKSIAGGLDMSKMMPDSTPPHWLVYFVVENTDNTVAKAKELGGTIIVEPQPTPMGPMAVIGDPAQATFAIIQITPQS
jgi:uncharacterized protein